MTEKAGKADRGPGSGAAKPVTEPPGGELDEALNEEPEDPGVEKGSRDQRDAGGQGATTGAGTDD
jgi:hypothetical protein